MIVAPHTPYDHHHVLELLLARGAMQAFDYKLNSLLHRAAEGGFVEFVKLLIGQGAYGNAEICHSQLLQSAGTTTRLFFCSGEKRLSM